MAVNRSSSSSYSAGSRAVSAGSVQSIERAAALLRAVAKAGTDGARLKDIAEEAGLLAPTARRLCRAMLKEGWLRQPEGQRRYFLVTDGPANATLSWQSSQLVMAGRNAVRRLSAQTGDTAYLFLRQDLDVLCIDRQEGSFAIKALAVNVGDWRPLGLGGAGLAVLSSVTEKSYATLKARLMADRPEVAEFGAAWLDENVRMSRQNGYAVTSDTGLLPGVTGFAVTIPWPSGEPFGALSVVAVKERLPEGRYQEIAMTMKQEVARIIEDVSGSKLAVEQTNQPIFDKET